MPLILPDDQQPGRRSDPATSCFVQLFQNRIILDNRVAPILEVFPPADNIPCVTMSKSGGLGEISDDTFYNYDDSNPPVPISKTKRITSANVMTLHAWGHQPEERDYIMKRILECIEDAKNDDYLFCSNYNLSDMTCSQTGNQCDAITVQNGQSIQRKCPYSDVTSMADPHFRGPKSIIVSAGMHRESVNPRGEVNVDQLDITPEVYHSAVAVDYKIDVDKILQIMTAQTLKFNEQILE